MSEFAMPYLAARWAGTPLMLQPAKAQIMARAYGPRVFGGKKVDAVSSADGFAPVPRSMGVLSEPLERESAEHVRPYIEDGVAVIGIEGVLCGKGKWVGESCGSTSYEGIIAQAAHAAADPMVRGVIFEVDSPGGEVAMAFECAAMLAELSALKPTLAILTEQACSAAYLLASQARQIVLPDTGYAGSIGVIMLHANMAGALDREGVDITILHAGARKADFNPYQALPADVRDEELADMELVRQMFAESVATGRGPRMNAAAALATEARTYRGAAAVAAGLCDAVAWPRAAKQAFIDAMNE